MPVCPNKISRAAGIISIPIMASSEKEKTPIPKVPFQLPPICILRQIY